MNISPYTNVSKPIPTDSYDSLVNYNSDMYNENYDYDIFFEAKEAYNINNIIGETDNIIIIDPDHLISMDAFMSFANGEIFTFILSGFREDISEFARLSNLYIEEENIKKSFNENIYQLICKIKNVSSYPILGNGIINLFATTRINLAKIVRIIKNLSQYHHNPQQTTEEASYFHRLCNISYDNLKNLIYDSITDIDACINGVNARFAILYNNLEAAFAGKSGLFFNKKNDLIKAFIQNTEINLINTSCLKYNTGMSVHFHIAIQNLLAKKFSLQFIEDEYSNNININKYLEEDITNMAELELLTVNITRSLADDLMEKFKNLLAVHDCLSWLNESLPSNYFINNDVFVDLDKNFFSICNSMYSPDINNMQAEIELQNNNLSFYDLITIEYKNDSDFFNIKNIDTKLHAWIASSFLPSRTHRILSDISNQQLSTDEHNLVIAVMGNCYFWVMNKKLIENNRLFDFNNHTPIQLKHISTEIFKNTTAKTYLPLILQALKQTKEAKEIIDFFNRNDVYNAISDNLFFTKYINNILSKKIFNDELFKNNMINIICSSTHFIRNVYFKKIFNFTNTYWFNTSVLLEPVLKQMINNDVDICAFINQLTIEQLITFENKFSLRNLYASIIDKQEYDTVNSYHFYCLFSDLNFFSSKAARYLLYSGLIDDVLFNFLDANNNNILMMAIINRDIDAINMLADFNRRLCEDKQIKINWQNKQQKTALILAVETGNLQYICSLFNLNQTISSENNKIDFNKKDCDGFTALMHATKKNYYLLILELFKQIDFLSSCISLNIQNNNNYTAIMLASENGDHNTFISLMSFYRDIKHPIKHYNIDISIKNYLGETALTLILKRDSLPLLSILLFSVKKYCDNNPNSINIESFKNDIINSLFYALTNNFSEEICYNLLIESHKILGITINFNLTKQNGDTLLMQAVLYNKPRFIEYLLTLVVSGSNENLSSISNKNNYGETAIFLSVKYDNISCLRVLLECCNKLNIGIDKEDLETTFKYAKQKMLIEHIMLLNEFKINHVDNTCN